MNAPRPPSMHPNPPQMFHPQPQMQQPGMQGMLTSKSFKEL